MSVNARIVLDKDQEHPRVFTSPDDEPVTYANAVTNLDRVKGEIDEYLKEAVALEKAQVKKPKV